MDKEELEELEKAITAVLAKVGANARLARSVWRGYGIQRRDGTLEHLHSVMQSAIEATALLEMWQEEQKPPRAGRALDASKDATSAEVHGMAE